MGISHFVSFSFPLCPPNPPSPFLSSQPPAFLIIYPTDCFFNLPSPRIERRTRGGMSTQNLQRVSLPLPPHWQPWQILGQPFLCPAGEAAPEAWAPGRCLPSRGKWPLVPGHVKSCNRSSLPDGRGCQTHLAGPDSGQLFSLIPERGKEENGDGSQPLCVTEHFAPCLKIQPSSDNKAGMSREGGGAPLQEWGRETLKGPTKGAALHGFYVCPQFGNN